MTAVEKKDISKAVISRLPRYYRYLQELKNQNIERISSYELSSMMHVTASQIRQDLNNFGGFGQQGYGYNVEFLFQEIGKILGLDKTHNMIICGAGHLGQALANFGGFEGKGFNICGLFDVREDLIGKTIHGIPVLDAKNLQKFVEENNVEIAAITVPREDARDVASALAEYGVKGIWNFASTDLHLGDEIVVENVHLSESLMELSYRVSNLD